MSAADHASGDVESPTVRVVDEPGVVDRVGAGRDLWDADAEHTDQQFAELVAVDARHRQIEQRRVVGCIGIVAVDPDGVIQYVSDALEEFLAIPISSALGRNLMEFIHPGDLDQAVESFVGVGERGGHHQALEFRVVGPAREVEVNVVAENRLDDPAIGLVLLNVADPSDRRRSARLLEAQTVVVQEIALGDSLSHALSAVATFVEAVVPGFGVAIYANAHETVGPLLTTTEASRETGHQMWSLLHPISGPVDHDDYGIPAMVALNDEEIVIAADLAEPMWSSVADVVGDRWGSVWSVPIRQGRGEAVRGVIELYGPHPAHPSDEDWAVLDLSSRMAAISIDHRVMRNRMERDATVDALTGCPNRRRLTVELEELVSIDATGALVGFIDLDRLKVVNDGLGHEAGDAVIRESAMRLASAVGSKGLVGRFGGDEFVVIVQPGVLEPAELAARCLDAFVAPIRSADRTWQMSASVGVVVVDGQQSASDLLRDADTAMYEAKQAGRNTWRLFDASNRESAVDRLQLEQSLRSAVSDGQIVAWYQPVVKASDWSLVGAEALARWQVAEDGWITPDRFIPLADELGLIDELGCQMIDQAMAALAEFKRVGRYVSKISVNVSPVQLQSEQLFDHLEAINADGRSLGRLCLEMTEEHIIDDTEWTHGQLSRLLETGASLAVDDFGTGYSSLAALHRLPAQIIKIDRGLVSQAHTEAGRAVLTAAVAVAKAYGLTVVGEGVETVVEAAVLHAVGVDLLQGFLFARPEPLDDLIKRAQIDGWCWEASEDDLFAAVAATEA